MKAVLRSQNIEMCSYESLQEASKIKCIDNISLFTSTNKSSNSVRIIPESPLSKDINHVVKINIPNKNKPGIYQVNLFSKNSTNEGYKYIGSWRLEFK